MDFSHLSSAEYTDVGRKRRVNEDSLIRIPEQGVFFVADGMGGAAGGDVASRTAIEEVRREFKTIQSSPFNGKAASRIDRVRKALNEASRRIKRISEEKGVIGTGTTAVLLTFDGESVNRASVMHAGDSRAYRYRDGKFGLLTNDHSVAAAAGVKNEKSLPSMFRGVVTRAVGLEETVELEETKVDVLPNDLYLLCSDGLTKMVPDNKIHKLLRKHESESLAVLAKLLVDEANRAGGNDNITVVLVKVGRSGDRPRPAGAADQSVGAADEAGTSDTAVGVQETPVTATGSPSRVTIQERTTDVGDTLEGRSPFTDEEATQKSVPTPSTSAPTQAAARLEEHHEPSTVEGSTPHTPRTSVQEMDVWKKRILPFGLPGVILLLVAVLLVFKTRTPQEEEPVAQVLSTESEESLPEISEPPVSEPPPAEPGPGVTGEPAPPVEEPKVEPKAEPEIALPKEPEPEAPKTVQKDDVPTEEVRNEVLAAFRQAPANGTWGKVVKAMGPYESNPAVFFTEENSLDVYSTWVVEWNKGRNEPGYIQATLESYAGAVATVCEQAGVTEALPKPPIPKGTLDEQADAFCRALYEYQRQLGAALQQFVTETEADMRVVGDDPSATVAHLGLFISAPVKTGSETVDKLLTKIGLLKQWTEGLRGRHVTQSEMVSGPATMVPEITALKDQFWGWMFQVLKWIRVAIGNWESKIGANPDLDNIDNLQFSITRQYQQNQEYFNTGAQKWPRPVDKPGIGKMVEAINRFVAAVSSGEKTSNNP